MGILGLAAGTLALAAGKLKTVRDIEVTGSEAAHDGERPEIDD